MNRGKPQTNITSSMKLQQQTVPTKLIASNTKPAPNPNQPQQQVIIYSLFNLL